MRALLLDVAELQYKVELELDGMTDLGSGVPYSDLLQKLRQRRKAWKELKWKPSGVVALDGDCWAYELVDGVFCKTGAGEFSMATLPSQASQAQVSRFTDFKLESVRDFAMDPTQDLIVFVSDEPMYVCLALRVGQPH